MNVISLSYLFLVKSYLCHIFFVCLTNVSKKIYHGYDIHKYLYQAYEWHIFIPFRHDPLPPWQPCGAFGPGFHGHALRYPASLQCGALQSQTQTAPPDEVCPSQTATAIGSARRRCFPSCSTRRLHLPPRMEIYSSDAFGARVGLSE